MNDLDYYHNHINKAMKVGIFITARLGSTRLERKHLLPVLGRPIIQVLIDRIRAKFCDEIIITTSDEPENREFEKFGKVFYGSPWNIPMRHLKAAVANDIDAIIAIDGDDILCSVEGMKWVYTRLCDGFPIIPYARTSGLPFGMNCTGYTAKFLEESLRGHEYEVLETGWNRIFDATKLDDIPFKLDVGIDTLRFTLDYEEDYKFFVAVLESFGDAITTATDKQIIDRVVASMLYRINDPVIGRYWENFYAGRAKEITKWDIPIEGKGQKLWEKAKTIIPGGGQLFSKRSERFLPGLWPAYYRKAKGCEVWDLNDSHYFDFAQMGVGSCVLGYADDDVNAAVVKAICSGSMCTLNCPEEVALAEKLISLHPWAGMARFARTGGEACAIAVRIGRAASGKDGVAFCGYHGWHDWYLAGETDGLSVFGVPSSLRGSAHPFRYNYIEDLKAIVDDRHGIGTIIMEPQRDTPPAPGFLESVREIASKINAVLIFDEVTSGFRINVGGSHLMYGIKPDVAVFGKALGNGFPISAVIGKKEIMEYAQDCFISSTFWTEKVGFSAALATIKKMEDCKVPDKLVLHGMHINTIWADVAHKHGIPIGISGIPPLTHLTFKCEDPLAVQTLYAQEMLSKGFLVGSSVYTTYAYTDEVIDSFGEYSDRVFETIGKAVTEGTARDRLRGDVIQEGFRRLT